jgi:hypothetical protein
MHRVSQEKREQLLSLQSAACNKLRSRSSPPDSRIRPPRSPARFCGRLPPPQSGLARLSQAQPSVAAPNGFKVPCPPELVRYFHQMVFRNAEAIRNLFDSHKAVDFERMWLDCQEELFGHLADRSNAQIWRHRLGTGDFQTVGGPHGGSNRRRKRTGQGFTRQRTLWAEFWSRPSGSFRSGFSTGRHRPSRKD